MIRRMHLQASQSCLLIVCLVLVGCAGNKAQTSWIQIGTTTKSEVIEQYGEPDLVRVLPEGETATYRPVAARRPSPSLEIPVAQAAPSGLSTTEMKPIKPGLGVGDVAAGKHDHPKTEVQIRYDARGIVRELIQ